MLTKQEMISVVDLITTATPLNVFIYLTFVVKVIVVITVCLGFAVLIGLLRRPKGKYSRSLSAFGGWALVVSLFGAAYSGLNSFLGFAGTSNPYGVYEIIPAFVAVLYVAGLAVFIWLISLWGNAGSQRA